MRGQMSFHRASASWWACVSPQLNGCDYCVEHHRAGMARHLKDEILAKELAAAAVADEHREPLTPREWGHLPIRPAS